MISVLNGIIQHSLFEKLLQTIQEYIETFNIRRSEIGDNTRDAIASYMKCSPNDAENYMETISKVLVQDIITQIISDWNNKKEQLPKYPKKLFHIEN